MFDDTVYILGDTFSVTHSSQRPFSSIHRDVWKRVTSGFSECQKISIMELCNNKGVYTSIIFCLLYNMPKRL